MRIFISILTLLAFVGNAQANYTLGGCHIDIEYKQNLPQGFQNFEPESAAITLQEEIVCRSARAAIAFMSRIYNGMDDAQAMNDVNARWQRNICLFVTSTPANSVAFAIRGDERGRAVALTLMHTQGGCLFRAGNVN